MTDGLPINATFTGIDTILAAQFTLSQGVSPGTGILEILPQQREIPYIGDLTFICGRDLLTLKNIRIGEAIYNTGRGGRTISLPLLDDRWRWKFGIISGRYNVRKADGSVEAYSEKSPQELARILLEEMRVTKFNVFALPNFARPFVDWEAETPAMALQNLCSSLGCRIAYDPTDGSVNIVTQGEGGELPGILAYELQDGSGIDPQERPDKLVFYAGYTQHQVRLPLEAVGLDVSGEIKPVEALSYRAPQGWGQTHPSMTEIPDSPISLASGAKVSQRELALQSVWRWYRVKEEIEVYLTTLKEGPTTVNRRDIIVLNQLAETYTDPVTNVKKPKPAQVYGTFWHEGRPDYANCPAGTKLELDFSVNTEQQLVQISQQLTKKPEEDGTIEPAELYLEAAILVRDENTNAIRRYTKDFRPKGNSFNAQDQPVKVEDVFLTIVHQYDGVDDSSGVDNLVINRKEVEDQADYYLRAAAKDYETPTTRDKIYCTIVPIQIDGAIQQVSWSFGTSGATTRASRGTEHDLAIPSYRERQLMLANMEAAKTAKKVAAQQQFIGGLG